MQNGKFYPYWYLNSWNENEMQYVYINFDVRIKATTLQAIENQGKVW